MPPALQNPITLWLLLTAALAGLVYAFLRPELRVKAIGYGAFLLACAVAVWPPYDREGQPGRIHLGLDLKGGIHLVLQVVVEDALNAVVDDAVNTARDQAARKGIQVASVARLSEKSFSVEGVEPARVKDVRDLLRDFFRGNWELREAGEGRFTVEMTDLYQRQVKDQTVQEAIRTLERRVNALGVAEPVIAAQGARGDQILVQLPGVTDVEQAKRVIKTTAQLSLKLVENVAATRETLLSATAKEERVPGAHSDPEQELIGHGIANVLLSLLGGLPATGSIVRASLLRHAGGRTRAAAIFHALFGAALIALILFADRFIPLAALAGVVIAISVPLCDPRPLRAVYRVSRAEALVYVTAEDFTNRFLQAMQAKQLGGFRQQFRKALALFIDDVHFLAGKEATQLEFVHTFDALHRAGRPVMVTSDSHPRFVSGLLQLEFHDALLFTPSFHVPPFGLHRRFDRHRLNGTEKLSGDRGVDTETTERETPGPPEHLVGTLTTINGLSRRPARVAHHQAPAATATG